MSTTTTPEEKSERKELNEQTQSTRSESWAMAQSKFATSQVVRERIRTADNCQAVLSALIKDKSDTRRFESTTDLSRLIRPELVLITCAGAGGGPGQYGSAGPSFVYDQLAQNFVEKNVATLQVIYSKTGDVAVAVKDVTAAIEWCLKRGWGPIVLFGWSMGSAVIVQAGAQYRDLDIARVEPIEEGNDSKVNTKSKVASTTESTTRSSATSTLTRPFILGLITLAGQSASVEKLQQFRPGRQYFLFLHGDADVCLPVRCADALYRLTPDGCVKQRVILPSDHHGVQSAYPILEKYLNQLLRLQPLHQQL